MTSTQFKLAGMLLALLAFGAPARGGAPNDTQIAVIVVAANQVNIDAGQLAEAQSGSTTVKAFARLMVTDHSGVSSRSTASSTSRRR